LEPLPGERYVFMKLSYTEDTPPDYEPPFFRKLTNADGHFSSRPFVMYAHHLFDAAFVMSAMHFRHRAMTRALVGAGQLATCRPAIMPLPSQ
jgi:hypothetical protein